MIRRCLLAATVLMCLGTTPVRADSFSVHAVVPPQASSFQLNGTAGTVPDPISQGAVITYRLTYGSYLYYQADIMVLEASWTIGTPDNGSPTDVVAYIPGSATTAEGGAAPVIDTANRRISWTIQPVPRAADQVVSFQLQTTDQPLNFQVYHLTINAHLISSGVDLSAQPLTLNYRYQPPSATPSPSGIIQPTLVFTPNPTPILSGPTSQPASNLLPFLNGILQVFPAIGQAIQKSYQAVTQTPLVGPVVKQVGQTSQSVAKAGGGAVSAPVPVVLIGAPAFSLLASILPYLSWSQVPGLLAALFLRRRRSSWGVVYDSITKQPLDPVIVTLIDSQGRLYQTISDIYGRYQFLAEPGDYRLTAQKSHYQFPSTRLANRQSDQVYDQLYFGQLIHLDSQGIINVNIPLDPLEADWNQAEKVRMGLSRRFGLVGSWRTLIFALGAIWSLTMLWLNQNTINGIIVGMYGLLLVSWLVYRHRHPWGTIRNARHNPVEGAVVNITNLAYPSLKRPPVVTKNTGRYSFLVDQGQYQVSVSTKQPDGSYVVMAATPRIAVRGKYGQISQNITLPGTK